MTLYKMLFHNNNLLHSIIISYVFPRLGNITVLSNTETVQDDAILKFIATAFLNSTGAVFQVAAELTFFNTMETVSIYAISQECKVILPTISTETSVSRT